MPIRSGVSGHYLLSRVPLPCLHASPPPRSSDIIICKLRRLSCMSYHSALHSTPHYPLLLLFRSSLSLPSPHGSSLGQHCSAPPPPRAKGTKDWEVGNAPGCMQQISVGLFLHPISFGSVKGRNRTEKRQISPLLCKPLFL